MKRQIIGILLIIIMLVYNLNISVYAKETPDELKNLYARSAVLMDADSGRILFGKNETDILPMASTTKLMTCILALEQMKDGQIGTVSEYASRQPKVHLGVRAGEQYYIRDLLYSLMLESHNDSAVVIAEAIAGSVEAFAVRMNQKAREIGCKNTYFITPNGLDAKDETEIHSTTASDLALIMRYCIMQSSKKEDFLNVTRERTYQFTNVDKTRNFTCNNHNTFLTMMDGVLSGKTGFTNNAGYCYVCALNKGKRTFIVVLLACGWPGNKGYKWKDTTKLMEYGLKNYEYKDLDYKIMTEPVCVRNGFRSSSPYENSVYVKTDLEVEEELKVLMNEKENIKISVIYNRNLKAPVKNGEHVGTVIYKIEDIIIKEVKIVTGENIKKREWTDLLSAVKSDVLL